MKPTPAPVSSGNAPTLWLAEDRKLSRARLGEHRKADVCIIGAGISGLTAAYTLSREGQKVIVLDDGRIASGETGRTTAHISNALDDHYQELERLHGEQGARLAAQSHTAAIDWIESTVARENIACDFERLDGYLFCAPGDSPDILEKEIAAAHRAGLAEVAWVGRAPIGGFDTGRCLRFPRQAQFHVTKYLSALAVCIEAAGGEIYGDSHAEAVHGGTPARVVTTDGRVVEAASIIVATNTPVNDRVAIHTKQAAYRSYVIGARIPLAEAPRMLLWDTADPYHYVRVQRLSGESSEAMLIVGGEDHKTGQADDGALRFARLEAWARERFPTLREVEYRWSGQVMEPIDGLAYIGRNPLDEANVYIATGDSGNGITHGTIAGLLLTDLIMGRANPWAAIYDPGRVRLGAASEFVKENLNVVPQYADWVKPGEVSSVEKIPTKSGCVLRRGLEKVAVYRDGEGKLHAMSAVCPHLGCIVDWNTSEQTWDCPCHGSRFGPLGQVLNGPANSDLKPIDQPLPIREDR